MTAKDLKNALLQEAVQGKLVPQIASEGNAKDLLEEIKKEKAKLIKEGKLKKEKPLPEISDDEIPFDIPDNWCWCRLNDITCKLTDGSHNPPPPKNSGYPVISAMNIKNGKITFDNVNRFTDQLGFEKENPRTNISNGDIILGIIGGSIGNIAIYDSDKKVIAQRSIAIINSFVSNYYISLLLQSPFIQSILHDSRGTAQGGIYLGSLKNLSIPLPPIAEQKRIVAAIEQFLPLIEEYGKKEAELTALNADIAKTLKNAILQEAVQGKLAPQIASEGNAKDLLEEIKKEKARLIREGKLKKEKPLPEITEDEIPFDIPENWCWCRLGEIGDWKAGSTPSRSNPELYNGNIPWLKTGDLTDGYINEIPEFISEKALESCSMRLNPIGSVLIAMYGATIGKLGILNIEATTNQACCACVPYNGIDNKYLFYYLMSQKKSFTEKAEGGAQPNISREKLVVHLFPLPPYKEQKCIVSAIEHLLSLCEKVEV